MILFKKKTELINQLETNSIFLSINLCLSNPNFSCRFDLVTINISFTNAMNLAGKKLLKSVNNTNNLHNQLNHIINEVRSLSSTSFCARMPRTSFMPLS